VIQLLGVNAQQTHEVQGVGVTGLEAKRLFATELGLEKSAGAHMIDAQLIEPGDAVRSALA
jgi:hypothetical protein